LQKYTTDQNQNPNLLAIFAKSLLQHCGEIPASIIVGRYNLAEYDNDYEVFYGRKEIRHPDFDEETVNNDFLLIVLDGVSKFPLIRLNSDASIPADNNELVVMGWGDVDPSDAVQTTSDYMRETTVLYVPNDECSTSKGWVDTEQGPTMGYYEGGISDNMMCALDNVGTVSDACQGDSGGGLIYPGEAEDGSEDIQVGIVRYVAGCFKSSIYCVTDVNVVSFTVSIAGGLAAPMQTFLEYILESVLNMTG
jgi:secreted trypsin-like serine protease